MSTQIWKYSRIYPLLDGLLQDVSATQVASLALNPNASNGTVVDALQQSLQVQLQYSQMAGVQNAAAAQAMTANSTYQSNLALQQTALLQDLSAAYSQLSAAQTNLQKLNASGTATATDIAIATAAVQAANANLSAIGTTISNLKNLNAVSAPTPANPLSTTPTLPSLSGSTLPTSITGAAANTTSGTPSFPPTKQMDNQINILWDRLARLVGTMSRPDSMEDGAKIYLVKFDTGIYPVNRKKELLDVTYSLSCGGVIDLFPRNAALNIVEDKYKDTAFGFGAVLNWFGVGGSVAYNREHLKASQLLGQSSYISGHGIGQKEFGWLFGISLGDDSISPGPRNTFALVWTPGDCKDADIKLKSANWVKPPDLKLQFPEPKVGHDPWTLDGKKPSAYIDPVITAIEFSRSEYDPTSGKAPVTIRLTLSQDMDQQQTVSVNGQLVQRIRDNFGRAISPTTSGTNGVLETGQMGTNTWIPTSPTTMLITLDSSLFGNQFPQILLSSPQQVIDVVNDRSGDSRIVVSGNTLTCDTPPCSIPSLGITKSVQKNLGAARWITDTKNKLCITVVDVGPSGTPITTSGGVPTVQVISDTDDQVWGSDAEVNILGSHNTIRRLNCQPGGSRLVCDMPTREIVNGKLPSVQLQVFDQHHAGNISIKGTVFTTECLYDEARSDQSCRKPLVWKTSPPRLAPNNTTQLGASKWRMWVQLVNVESADTASLGSLSADALNGHTFDCSKGADEPCIASFTIPITRIGSISDWMNLQVSDQQGMMLGGRAAITNVLANLKPIITQINDERKSWSGRNLVFNNIRVRNSSTVAVDCLSDGSQCNGNGSYGKSPGYMYFVVSEGLAFPFNQINSTGTNTAVIYTPKAQNNNPVPNTAPTSGALALQNLNASPQLKSLLGMQAVQ